MDALLHVVKLVAYALHIGGGVAAFAAGAVAVTARKGGRLHRLSGTVFFVAMLVIAAFGAVLAVLVPGQIVNLFISAFVVYLVATAWLAVRRPAGTVGVAEKIGVSAAALLCLPFGIVAWRMATGALPIHGPVLIALYAFALVIVVAAISDARVVLAGGLAGPSRLARHLWRMCLAFTLAAGSFFTNALPRLLPGPMHVTLANFLPQFFLLGLLVFWMIRVRLTPWASRHAAP